MPVDELNAAIGESKCKCFFSKREFISTVDDKYSSILYKTVFINKQ